MRNRIHRDIIPTRLYYCLLTGSYHFVITLTSFPAASTISRSSCLKHFILDANKSSFYIVRFHLKNKKKEKQKNEIYRFNVVTLTFIFKRPLQRVYQMAITVLTPSFVGLLNIQCIYFSPHRSLKSCDSTGPIHSRDLCAKKWIYSRNPKDLKDHKLHCWFADDVTVARLINNYSSSPTGL